MKAIGYVTTEAKEIPRSWQVSNIEGTLVMDQTYLEGLRDIKPGDRLYVLFHFHKSPEFSDQYMQIKPPLHDKKKGVFSTHSPIRPNPIGMSILEVLGIEATNIRVKGLDMLDRTPIWDIKPVSCPKEKE
jgi:tRNA (adenine37-N6)-methyltransferase